MSKRTLTALIVVLVAGSPVQPSARAAPPEKADGVYTLSFALGSEGLVLIAHIKDTSENSATDGFVVFQHCAFKGVPKTQPAEAPSSACLDGSGTWRTQPGGGRGTPVTLSGDALHLYGPVSPAINVIGFRGKYIRGSEIADGVTDPMDWIR